ncbi:TPR repeat-containing protein [Saccharospirillum salsuginis]|uniref:TPR repeat-containing protein n=2 Tax=Saccharospirillum salsuginis TaxID=418750 RepID=A0A918NFB8_9GAMM|nr:TPR repeat-containing protein [Saccharospirillum salsuginis]
MNVMPMMIPFQWLKTPVSVLVLSLSLAGCSAMPQEQAEQSDPVGAEPSGAVDESRAAAEPEFEREPLTGQIMYQLLLAEIATNRQEYGTAAELYSRLDQTTEDAEIARRAAALNQVVGNYERMLSHAEHWTSLSPESTEAWQALAIASLAEGRFESGEAALNRWLTLDPQADVEAALIGSEGLDETEQGRLLTMLNRLAEQHPQNSGLPFASAQLLASRQQYDEALTKVREARALRDSPRRGLLEYRILLQQDDLGEARTALEDLAAKYPQNSQVATAYAGFAYAEGDEDKTAVLESLFNRFPNEPVIVRAFARESFDNGDFDTAEALFKRLTSTTDYADEAHYFLGRINKDNAREEQAAEQFLSIEEPPFLISGLAELSELWRDERMDDLTALLERTRGRFPEQAPVLWRIEADAYRNREEYEQAFDALQEGLNTFPDNPDLLYDQAMVAGRLKRYQVLEDNLTRALEMDPDDASSLNALGYTWADLDRNLQQAREYIDRALDIRPDDPAIMDSKGWVEYRLGNLETAEEWLRKALAEFDNDEVAAHLAEVLWQQGEREEARKWLRHAFDLNPQSPTATSVQDRLGIEL